MPGNAGFFDNFSTCRGFAAVESFQLLPGIQCPRRLDGWGNRFFFKPWKDAKDVTYDGSIWKFLWAMIAIREEESSIGKNHDNSNVFGGQSINHDACNTRTMPKMFALRFIIRDRFKFHCSIECSHPALVLLGRATMLANLSSSGFAVLCALQPTNPYPTLRGRPCGTSHDSFLGRPS